MKHLFHNGLLFLVSVAVSLIFAELICRVLFFGSLHLEVPSDGSEFWQYDAELGWSSIPGIQAHFSNQFAGFDAKVSFNRLGVRENGQPALVSDPNVTYKSLLLLGDSTTAGLQVDDNKTYAALLERKLNESACHYRVYNAGVPGYGTDQSLWNLRRLQADLKPDAVMYMFTSNDLRDNQTIKRAQRLYSKPVLVMRDNGDVVRQNYPAAKFDYSYYAFVRYHSKGYDIEKGYLRRDSGLLSQVKKFIANHLALYYPVRMLFSRREDPSVNVSESDPRVGADWKLMQYIIGNMQHQNPNLFITAFATHQEDDKYTSALSKLSETLGLTYLDIALAFDEPAHHFHWRGDAHWNEYGHQHAADALYEQLSPLLCP